MSESVNARDLEGTWIHSHEEDQDDRIVYRTSSFSFPRSRGRKSMTLRADGVADFGFPGADDRSRSQTGRWSLAGKTLTIEGPGRSQILEIVELNESALVVRRTREEI